MFGKGSGVRGVALGLAVAVTLGASSGMLLSRVSAQASPRQPIQPLAISFSPPQPVEQAAPKPVRVRDPDPFPATKACGPRRARTLSFRVSVERGLRVSRATFARAVRWVLCDARGWIGSGAVRFRYHPDGDYLISLRSAEHTESRCMDLIGLSVHAKWSCASAREAVLNAARWFNGSPTLNLSVGRYRALLVNHEVGHLLGHGHRGCSGAGEKAPVMMQQSKGLSGCRANPWPLPSELGLF